MNLEELRAFCLSLPSVTEDIKWEYHLCFSVGGKMFIITAPDEVPVTASFKTSDENFEKLTARSGFIPAPYMARNKWVHLDDIARLTHKQWKELMQESYDLVFEKLTGKLKKEILRETPSRAKKSPIKKSSKKKEVKKNAKK